MNVATRPKELHVISLCTGGAGLDIGLGLAVPSRAVVMVERESFAVANLVKAMQQGHLAECPIWSDARTFDGRAFRGCVDGLIGGIPCQPHSLAGKRLGEDDERDLWSTARRIIVQSGAWFVLIENVGGMLSSGGAERVWRDLRRLGFAVEGGLFTAAEVGASHQRERLFILAVADRLRSEWRPIECGGITLADGPDIGWREEAGRSELRREDVADAMRSGRPEIAGRAYGHEVADERRTSEYDHELDGLVEGLANAIGERNEARFPAPSGWHGIGSEPTILDDACDALVDAESLGRGEGRTEPEFRSGRGPAAVASGAMANADVAFFRGQPPAGEQLLVQRKDEVGLFPPGPGDVDGWRAVLARAPQLEPAVRRMADGMASRVDRLRMLGNGVVPLAAAHAIRTLAVRLARTSSGAAQLVRLMEMNP